MSVLNGTHFELKALSLLGDIFSSLCSFCHHLSPQLQPQAWRSCMCVKGPVCLPLAPVTYSTGLKQQVREAESKRQDQQINIHQGCRTQVVPAAAPTIQSRKRKEGLVQRIGLKGCPFLPDGGVRSSDNFQVPRGQDRRRAASWSFCGYCDISHLGNFGQTLGDSEGQESLAHCSHGVVKS